VNAGTGTVTVDANCPVGYTDFDDTVECSGNLAPVLNCSKGQVITFYVDDDATDGIGPGSTSHPVLMMDLDFEWPEADDVPLVDDIEDIQFAYCTQNKSCNSSTNWQQTLALGEIPWMVRLSLVARSARENYGDYKNASRPGLENHGASATIDGYYRQVLTTEVSLRNMRML